MEPLALVLESLLGLFLLLSGCLFIRTMMLETSQPRHIMRKMQVIVHLKDNLEQSRHVDAEAEVVDVKVLEDCGLTSVEIAALERLKKWYQVGEGDRAVLLARWECLKRLKLNGKLDV
jgi:hypothetical protein